MDIDAQGELAAPTIGCLHKAIVVGASWTAEEMTLLRAGWWERRIQSVLTTLALCLVLSCFLLVEKCLCTAATKDPISLCTGLGRLQRSESTGVARKHKMPSTAETPKTMIAVSSKNLSCATYYPVCLPAVLTTQHGPISIPSLFCPASRNKDSSPLNNSFSPVPPHPNLGFAILAS